MEKEKNETKQNKMQQVEKKRSGAVEKRRASEQQQQRGRRGLVGSLKLKKRANELVRSVSL